MYFLLESTRNYNIIYIYSMYLAHVRINPSEHTAELMIIERSEKALF